MSWGRRRWSWVGLAVVVGALVVNGLHRNGPTGMDFHTYLAAARVGLDQGWSHIYERGPVAFEQNRLAPNLWAQTFLSPPPVAWLAALVAWLPYSIAYVTWAVSTFLAFALSLAWSSSGHGVNRWLAVAGALSPWWVMHAVDLGQVAPLVAAGVVVAYRLVREEHDLAAGLVLSVVWFKPNTAILVPVVLLIAGRRRTFTAWLLVSAAIAVAAALIVGPVGMSAYAGQLLGRPPQGGDFVTLHGALGVTGWAVTSIRALIVAAVLVTAHKCRASPHLLIALGAIGSLIVSPYLHASDLCLLAAAAWMMWEANETARWRVPIAVGWVLASPYVLLGPVGAQLSRWPLVEIALLLAIIGSAWQPFTSRADLRRRAPA